MIVASSIAMMRSPFIVDSMRPKFGHREIVQLTTAYCGASYSATAVALSQHQQDGAKEPTNDSGGTEGLFVRGSLASQDKPKRRSLMVRRAAVRSIASARCDRQNVDSGTFACAF